eukprot:4846424-Pyramimonas_sp.AAC.1
MAWRPRSVPHPVLLRRPQAVRLSEPVLRSRGQLSRQAHLTLLQGARPHAGSGRQAGPMPPEVPPPVTPYSGPLP